MDKSVNFLAKLDKRLWILLIILAVLLSALTYLNSKKQNAKIETQASVPQKVAPLDHIILIVMENKSYDDIVGNDEAPYINSLIKKGALAKNYDGVAHPSLPNYIALLSGDTFGITSDCMDCFVSNKNLVDSLVTAGKTWKAYMEGMPSPCFLGNSGSYAQKHNPFIYFDDVKDNPVRCANIVPYSQLISDLTNNMANFIWISPNLCNDMHDCSVATGDKWLKQNIPLIISSPELAKSNYLIAVVWDEADVAEKNHVPAIFYGPQVKADFQSNGKYNHYSLLSLIEKNWNLPPLSTNDKNAPPMSDLFK